MEENDIYSISEINNLIDKKISYSDDFKKIKIRGEITNFNGSYKIPAAGKFACCWYFFVAMSMSV